MAGRRHRCANFTQSEKDLLGNIISKYRDEIESKKVDQVSIQKKLEAWNLVKTEFNATSGIVRSLQTIKNCWSNIKRKCRKSGTPYFLTDVVKQEIPDQNFPEEQQLTIQLENVRSVYNPTPFFGNSVNGSSNQQSVEQTHSSIMINSAIMAGSSASTSGITGQIHMNGKLSEIITGSNPDHNQNRIYLISGVHSSSENSYQSIGVSNQMRINGEIYSGQRNGNETPMENIFQNAVTHGQVSDEMSINGRIYSGLSQSNGNETPMENINQSAANCGQMCNQMSINGGIYSGQRNENVTAAENVHQSSVNPGQFSSQMSICERRPSLENTDHPSASFGQASGPQNDSSENSSFHPRRRLTELEEEKRNLIADKRKEVAFNIEHGFADERRKSELHKYHVREAKLKLELLKTDLRIKRKGESTSNLLQ